jgi:hypothetical protein
MKPFRHARNCVRKWKGKVEDYLPVHDFLDQSKGHFADFRHRALLHSSFGCYLAEQVFGHNITNSSGITVSVRDIAEQHILEDLGTIPCVADYLNNMTLQPWMGGRQNKKKIKRTIYLNGQDKPAEDSGTEEDVL